MFFDEIVNIRFTKEEHKKLRLVVRKNKHRYESVSHFVRCAIMKLAREELSLLEKERLRK